MQLKYFKELDGVRGLAAIMVVLFHIKKAGGDNNDVFYRLLTKAGNFGQTGVILFFVLSGFLITRILLVSKHKEGYFKKFYIRRSLRIFPLYYLALVVFIVIVPYFSTGKIIPVGESWPFWIYLQNIWMTFKWHLAGPDHFWSLAVEEHFYLVWPFVVYFCSEKALLRIIGLVMLLSICFRVLLLHNGYGGIFYFTPTTMDCLAIGGFIALNEKHQWIGIKQLLYISLSTIIILIINWRLFGGEGNDYIQILKLPAIATFYMSIINLLIVSSSYANRFFKSGILTFTGKISYGLYVFHPLCITFIVKCIHGPFWLNFILIFASSYAIACCSYYGYEVWFLKLKDKFETFSWTKLNSTKKVTS